MGKFIKILLLLICWVANVTAQEITAQEASELRRELSNKKMSDSEKIKHT